mgnify:FL=1
MKYSVENANQYVKERMSDVDQTYKPDHHVTAPIGWINDPNGFVYFRGEYHLFYQYYPYDSVWGPMHWGHAKSKDLVNWEHLPVALAPDQEYDRNGCFSGSAIVKDDQLWLMYTGHIEEEDGVRQVQNMAYSEDGIHFTKIKQNPVATGEMLPEEVSFRDFRDPKVFEKDGRYYSVVASQHKDQVGCIVLLGSDDLVDWHFESIFLKGEAHQGHVFECPDFFELDGKECLIVSPMRYEREGDSFHNINSSVLFTGKVDWDSKQFIPDSVEEIDHGQDFYAPQTLVDDQGRRIMVAWMQMWGRNIPSHELGHKWAGAMTLPRQLELIDGKLYQRILPSTETAMTPVYLNEPIRGFSRFQVEVIEGVHYQLGTTDDFLSFGYNADAEEVYIDRSHLKQAISGEETISTSRRFVSCRSEKLDVVFDCNSIEIFVNDGREVLSATYYLTGEKYLTKVS